MPVKIVKGDLFRSQAQTLVIPVNCIGVMGAGLANEMRGRFYDAALEYHRLCKEKELRIGKPCLYKRETTPWILLFPTKGHWQTSSMLTDIALGTAYLAQHYEEWGIESLAVPALGCGLGRLRWSEVAPILQAAFDTFTIPVWLYAPKLK